VSREDLARRRAEIDRRWAELDRATYWFPIAFGASMFAFVLVMSGGIWIDLYRWLFG
jgi:hypothetical protein